MVLAGSCPWQLVRVREAGPGAGGAGLGALLAGAGGRRQLPEQGQGVEGHGRLGGAATWHASPRRAQPPAPRVGAGRHGRAGLAEVGQLAEGPESGEQAGPRQGQPWRAIGLEAAAGGWPLGGRLRRAGASVLRGAGARGWQTLGSLPGARGGLGHALRVRQRGGVASALACKGSRGLRGGGLALGLHPRAVGHLLLRGPPAQTPAAAPCVDVLSGPELGTGWKMAEAAGSIQQCAATCCRPSRAPGFSCSSPRIRSWHSGEQSGVRRARAHRARAGRPSAGLTWGHGLAEGDALLDEVDHLVGLALPEGQLARHHGIEDHPAAGQGTQGSGGAAATCPAALGRHVGRGPRAGGHTVNSLALGPVALVSPRRWLALPSWGFTDALEQRAAPWLPVEVAPPGQTPAPCIWDCCRPLPRGPWSPTPRRPDAVPRGAALTGSTGRPAPHCTSCS